MTMKNQTTLIQDLRRFGLNPQDWSIKKIDSQRFKLSHKQDPDFVMLGKGSVKSTRPRWDLIQLISL